MIKDLRANTIAPHLFSEHTAIPLMLDALHSFEPRPILLTGCSSIKINLAIIEGLFSHINAQFFYCDAQNLEQVKKELEPSNLAVLVTTHLDALKEKLDPFFRLIVLTHEKFINTECTVIQLDKPSEIKMIELLKSYCVTLTKHHAVTITDEAVPLALTLAKRYLPSTSLFDQAFELLDQAAARARLSKSAVTPHTLYEIVSQRTRIPNFHLQHNKFQAEQLTHALTQHIYGQENAIAHMIPILQQAYINLNQKKGPLCSFLISGSSDTGKTEFAVKTAEYLFGHSNALLRIALDTSYQSIEDIPDLLDTVQQQPYTIILIDDIQPEQINILNILKPIFTRDDFSQSIIIMTTKIGAESFSHLLHRSQEQDQTINLLQLVLNENVLDIPEHMTHTPSAQVLCEKLTPVLEKHFPAFILEQTHITPFIPLSFVAQEKIIRLKIKELIKQMDQRFDIQLNYTPEVIKFLAHEAYWKKIINPLKDYSNNYSTPVLPKNCCNTLRINTLLADYCYNWMKMAMLYDVNL